jgi:uncharacterized membrane protein HdeD (DUF308 family)
MSLATALKSRWGGVMLRGVLALLVGLLAIVNPVATVLTLTVLFAVFAIVEGGMALVAGWQASPREGALVLLGLLGVIVGVIGLTNPGLLALTLITWIGIWAAVRGLLELSLAFRLRREIRGEGWLMLGGALSVAFGVLLLAKPLVGLVAEGTLFGIYCAVLGAALIALALRLKRLPVA